MSNVAMAGPTKKELEAQIETLETKINQLIETASKTPPPPPPPQQTPPPPPPPPPPQQTTYATTEEKSRKEILEDYENEYLARLEKEQHEHEKIMQAAEELAAKRRAESAPSTVDSNRGSMPKGWTPS